MSDPKTAREMLAERIEFVRKYCPDDHATWLPLIEFALDRIATLESLMRDAQRIFGEAREVVSNAIDGDRSLVLGKAGLATNDHIDEWQKRASSALSASEHPEQRPDGSEKR